MGRLVDWLVGQLAHWLAGASAYMPVPWLVGRLVNVFGCHRNGEQNPVEWGQISYVHPSVQAKDRPKATVKNNAQGVAVRDYPCSINVNNLPGCRQIKFVGKSV